MNCVIRNNYVKFGDKKLISDILKYLKDHKNQIYSTVSGNRPNDAIAKWELKGSAILWSQLPTENWFALQGSWAPITRRQCNM